MRESRTIFVRVQIVELLVVIQYTFHGAYYLVVLIFDG